MEDRNEFEGDEGLKITIRRFENMLRRKEECFYDVEEFGDIFDFYFTKNKINRANQAIQIGLSQHPHSTELKLRFAQMQIRKRKYKEGITLLNELLTLEPNNPDIYILKAEIYADLDHSEQAIKNYKKALRYIEPEDRNFLYIDIANEYQNIGKFDKAILYLEKAIERDPMNDMAYMEILFSFQISENVEQALVFFNRQIDKNPYNHLAWFYAGICLYDLELYEKSEDAFSYAIAIKDDFYEAYLQRAEALIALEQFDEAIAILKEVLRNDKQLGITYFTIGTCYEQKEEYEDALHYYQLAINKNPGFADAWLGAGVVLNKLDKNKESFNYIKKSVELDSSNTESLMALAELNKDNGLFEEALENYLSVKQIDPTLPYLWLEFSELFFVVGNIEQAIEIITEGMQIIPDNADLKYRLAAYFYSINLNEEAHRILIGALELDRSKLQDMFDFNPYLINNPEIIDIIENFREE